MGLRYRLGGRDLPGRPDLVFVSRRLAVFVHGCFWHGHDCSRGARLPATNSAYWSLKIARNRIRDSAACEKLSALGWSSAVIWECEIRKACDLEAIVCERIKRHPVALARSG
jgi:DNA mismatch endonuclease (patch repair protein)